MSPITQSVSSNGYSQFRERESKTKNLSHKWASLTGALGAGTGIAFAV